MIYPSLCHFTLKYQQCGYPRYQHYQPTVRPKKQYWKIVFENLATQTAKLIIQIAKETTKTTQVSTQTTQF